jgi:hypothetical protein
MSAQENPFEAGLERLKALMTWWGMPVNTMSVGEQQMQRFQSFVSDLQKAVTDTSSREVDTLFTLNQRVAGLLQRLLQCHQPQEILATLTDIQAAMLEGGLSQAKAWADLTQQVQEQYAALSKAAPGNPSKQPGDGEHRVGPTPAKGQTRVKVGSGGEE